ncbi:branched-chain amino acid ABC transporter permease [Bradyrhizobium sp. KB893862 SZCCT0404]|uniref:branched-chain amino acid ABC transporter permease n=1 Tax=Bradyrhizobium sp. KB893862 SZCCT0404 TaxID=2807672 RepID=UPI001BAA48BC|nr:branched-chain amino acid ABC transporter permease [Bradyrhizobium sp. KB893862 SZCCT0404]MBR1177005.1 branched-chain amino acid ABC transporter permease [Bradyrhizobium sp. KB893862 SZCCT0404]
MDRKFTTPALFALVAVLGIGPQVMSVHTIVLVTLVATTAIITSGLTVVTGLAGQITLAQAAFCAFGAYGATLVSAHMGMPMWATIPVAAVMSALIGYTLGVMSLRVEGHYLALVTLAFSGIVNLALVNLPGVTGGAVGHVVPPLKVYDHTLTSPTQIYYVSVVSALIVFTGLHNLIRSRWGRAFNALRQSEVAARSLGIDVRRARAIAFAISAGLAALGGALQSLQTTYLDPQQFTILTSVSYLSVMVIGGLRRLSGAVFGAAIFVLMPELLGAFKTYMGLIFALILLAIILIAPSGLGDLFGRVRRLRPAEVKP